MRYRFFLVFLLLALVSGCNLFDTEKISSEKIFEEEIQAIDWTEVDRYPIFPNCKEDLNENAQKECFIKTINIHLLENLNANKILATREISDTLLIDFEIDERGKLSILEIAMDTLMQQEFPNLKKQIIKSLDSLQPIAPAYKRGIPVKTQFSLPVVILTE